jgi:hypothetical protein
MREEQERENRRKEFLESKKPLKERLIEGLGLSYDFDSDSYSVRDVRVPSHQVPDMCYLESKLRKHPDLLAKAEEIWEKSISERPISFMFGKD